MGNQTSHKVQTLEVLDEDDDPETAHKVNKDSFLVNPSGATPPPEYAPNPGHANERGGAGAPHHTHSVHTSYTTHRVWAAHHWPHCTRKGLDTTHKGLMDGAAVRGAARH